MIGRGFWRKSNAAGVDQPNKGFDAFELRLGDLMRGERATLGKSLLDVQRELKIKASYIAAIENADPSAFDTPGFIAGYVRSYARYLNMDPDWAFDKFCRESGFSTSHGMSPLASATTKLTREERLAAKGAGHDIFANATTPFIPASDSFFSGFEPRAAGSVVVLVALISALGFGAWSVLQEVQKVKFAPVEQAPTVVADIDPLAGGMRPRMDTEDLAALVAPSAEALDRLYRPQALAVPVLVPRDGPIAALSPAPTPGLNWATAGLEAELEPSVFAEAVLPADESAPATPRVTSGPVPELSLVAARVAWVRVNASDGSVLFEGILNPGDTFEVPVTEAPAKLRVGESGALYFAVNGVPHGPVGPSGVVTSNIALDVASITETYQPADLSTDRDLAEIVRLAQADIPAQ